MNSVQHESRAPVDAASSVMDYAQLQANRRNWNQSESCVADSNAPNSDLRSSDHDKDAGSVSSVEERMRGLEK